MANISLLFNNNIFSWIPTRIGNAITFASSGSRISTSTLADSIPSLFVYLTRHVYHCVALPSWLSFRSCLNLSFPDFHSSYPPYATTFPFFNKIILSARCKRCVWLVANKRHRLLKCPSMHLWKMWSPTRVDMAKGQSSNMMSLSEYTALASPTGFLATTEINATLSNYNLVAIIEICDIILQSANMDYLVIVFLIIRLPKNIFAKGVRYPCILRNKRYFAFHEKRAFTFGISFNTDIRSDDLPLPGLPE